MTPTIAIIGAGPGVGLAIAERFGREGFQVALIARQAAPLEQLAARLQQQGITAKGFTADARDRAALTQALHQVIAHFGAIDVLEYNPSPARDSIRTPRLIDVDAEQAQLDLTLLGAIAAVQTVLPGMLQRRSGAVLFTTAASAQFPVTFTASFGVAAGAVLNYARVLYQDLKPDGIYAGLVAIAGLVVQRGEEHQPSPSGLPLVAAQDVADAHWRLYQERDTAETIVGDLDAIKAKLGAIKGLPASPSPA